MKITLIAKVVGAQLLWNNAAEAVRVLTSFEGHEVSVPLSRLRKTRSYLQNSYYWGVPIEILYEAFVDFGEHISREEIHEMLKVKFLLREMIGRGGAIIGHYAMSTTKLSTIEFMEYVARIQQWAVETFGIFIPDPNERLIKQDEQ